MYKEYMCLQCMYDQLMYFQGKEGLEQEEAKTTTEGEVKSQSENKGMGIV